MLSLQQYRSVKKLFHATLNREKLRNNAVSYSLHRKLQTPKFTHSQLSSELQTDAEVTPITLKR